MALSLLQKNFARVGSEKSRIISQLRNLPAVGKPYDYPAISNLVTTVQRYISILAVNGVTLPEFALTLLNSMQAALPARVRQEFLDQQKADERYSVRNLAHGGSAASTSTIASTAGKTAATEVECLIDFLRQRLRDIEQLRQDKDSISSGKKGSDGLRKNSGEGKGHPQSTIAAVTKSASGNGGKTPSAKQFRPRQCFFCKSSEHSSSRCSANVTVTQRLETLRSLGRCERCFRLNHSALTECQGPRYDCDRCKSKEHYTSMHRETLASVGGSISAVIS